MVKNRVIQSSVLLFVCVGLLFGCEKENYEPEWELESYNGFNCDSMDYFVGDYMGEYSYYHVDSLDTISYIVPDSVIHASNSSTSLDCRITFDGVINNIHGIPNSTTLLFSSVSLVDGVVSYSYNRFATIPEYPPWIEGELITRITYTGVKQ